MTEFSIRTLQPLKILIFYTVTLFAIRSASLEHITTVHSNFLYLNFKKHLWYLLCRTPRRAGAGCSLSTVGERGSCTYAISDSFHRNRLVFCIIRINAMRACNSQVVKMTHSLDLIGANICVWEILGPNANCSDSWPPSVKKKKKKEGWDEGVYAFVKINMIYKLLCWVKICGSWDDVGDIDSRPIPLSMGLKWSGKGGVAQWIKAKT